MIPSREEMLKKFLEDYKKAIFDAISIDKKSFEQYSILLDELKVAGDDISARLVFSVAAQQPKGLRGFEIAVLFTDDQDEMCDFTRAYIDLNNKKANEKIYGEIYLPQNMNDIKKIKVSLTNLITEDEVLAEEEN